MGGRGFIFHKLVKFAKQSVSAPETLVSVEAKASQEEASFYPWFPIRRS